MTLLVSLILIYLTSTYDANECVSPDNTSEIYERYDPSLDCFYSLFWPGAQNIYLSWTISEDILNMTVKTEHTGYYAIGFSPTKQMPNADAIITTKFDGGPMSARAYKLVDVSQFGSAKEPEVLSHFQKFQKPPGYLLTLSVKEPENGLQSMSFSRLLDTGSSSDITIKQGANGVIFALGVERNYKLEWHAFQKAATIDLTSSVVTDVIYSLPLPQTPFINFGSFILVICLMGLCITQSCRSGLCANLLVYQRVGLPPQQDSCCGKRCVRYFTLDCYSQTMSLTWSEFLALVLYLVGAMGATTWLFASEMNHRASGPSKVSGWMMAISLMMNFVPVTKNSLLIYIFGIPFNRAIKFHRFLARISLFIGFLHFLLVINRHDVEVALEFEHENLEDVVPLYGFVAYFLMVVMGLSSLIRRKYWEIFRILHFLFIPVVVFQLLHVKRVENYVMILIPIGLLFIDKIIIAYATCSKHKAEILSMIPLSHVTKLELRLKSGKPLDFRAGGYCFICIPQISNVFEWHPFSISSMPGDKNFTFHIKSISQNSFTGKLYNWSKAEYDSENQGTDLPNVFIDGPYGKLSMDLENYRHVILCGAGIGVTPLASILSDLHAERHGKYRSIRKVAFIWVIRNSAFITWFSHLFDKIRDTKDDDDGQGRKAGGHRFEVRIYNTMKAGDAQHPLGEWDEEYDDEEEGEEEDMGEDMIGAMVGTIGRNRKVMEVLEQAQDEEETGLKELTGRPKFRELFLEITGGARSPDKVAVVTCGPTDRSEERV